MKNKKFCPARLITAVTALAALWVMSCLEDIGLVAPPALSGVFTFIDESNAAVLITNQSRTVTVTSFGLTTNSPDAHNSTIVAGGIMPLHQKAMSVTPSAMTVGVTLSYTAPANHARGWEAQSGVAWFNISLPLARQVEEILIFRATTGEVVVRLARNTFDTAYPDPDPADTGSNPIFMLGEGSVPAAVPSGMHDRIASFIVINDTNTADVLTAEFRQGGRTFIMSGISILDQQSIALAPGTWNVRITYWDRRHSRVGGTAIVNVITVPPGHPQALQQHRLFFIRNENGIHDIVSDPARRPTPDARPPGTGTGGPGTWPGSGPGADSGAGGETGQDPNWPDAGVVYPTTPCGIRIFQAVPGSRYRQGEIVYHAGSLWRSNLTWTAHEFHYNYRAPGRPWGDGMSAVSRIIWNLHYYGWTCPTNPNWTWEG